MRSSLPTSCSPPSSRAAAHDPVASSTRWPGRWPRRTNRALGETANRLGAFLLFTIYQGDVLASAMWLTSQASNALIAKFAFDTAHVEISDGRWILGSIVPALVLFFLIPTLLCRLYPPAIEHTPDAARIATEELHRMGPMSRHERMMLVVFALVAGLWMTKTLQHINYAVVGLVAISVLLLGNLRTWDDVIGERPAWDVFIMYGGLARMAEALGETGLIRKFAESAASLTHYGTTPAPIDFGSGYISQRDWWLYGFMISVLSIFVFTTVGLGWWKLLGWW
jgi:anion transporter